jgi:hypothetical protein
VINGLRIRKPFLGFVSSNSTLACSPAQFVPHPTTKDVFIRISFPNAPSHCTTCRANGFNTLGSGTSVGDVRKSL